MTETNADGHENMEAEAQRKKKNLLRDALCFGLGFITTFTVAMLLLGCGSVKTAEVGPGGKPVADLSPKAQEAYRDYEGYLVIHDIILDTEIERKVWDRECHILNIMGFPQDVRELHPENPNVHDEYSELNKIHLGPLYDAAEGNESAEKSVTYTYQVMTRAFTDMGVMREFCQWRSSTG